MRTVMRLMMSALVLSGVTVWAQQASSCQLEEKVLARAQALGQAQAAPPQDLDAAKEALAQCQARQAKLAQVRAHQSAIEAQIEDLRKKYSDSYPDIVANGKKLAELRAQEEALTRGLRRGPDPQTSLKQATGGLQTGLPDRWWKNPATAQSLGLTADQQKKMDDTFQQSRLKLIDLNAALEKEEVTLEPLVAAEPLDESKVTAQIDRVAQARAELEKANGRMLLGIRKQLTPEQWTKLSQISR
jgi:Spy/CpxP family protein refolding chaperone